MRCPNCEAEVEANFRFCMSCGVRIAIIPVETTASSHPPLLGPRRAWLAVIVLLYAALFSGSAVAAYLLLDRRAASGPRVETGTPRLVATRPVEPASPPGEDARASTSPSLPAHPKAPPRRPASRPGPGKLERTAGHDLEDDGEEGESAHAGRERASKKAPSSQPARKPRAGTLSPTDRYRASLDAESAKLTIRHYLPQVRSCYERALKQAGSLGGTVEVRFVIDAEGQVKSSQVFRNTTGHDGLGKCIAFVLKGWRFPKPISGEVEFVHPFVFSSGED
jgi:TonB family protein